MIPNIRVGTVTEETGTRYDIDTDTLIIVLMAHSTCTIFEQLDRWTQVWSDGFSRVVAIVTHDIVTAAINPRHPRYRAEKD
jgi:hypothetical protein